MRVRGGKGASGLNELCLGEQGDVRVQEENWKGVWKGGMV